VTRPLERHRSGLLSMALAGVGLWLVWPWIRPVLFPAAGRPWLLVLDGYHRLDHALTLQRQEPFRGWPILLITCPATGQPTAFQRHQASLPLSVLYERPRFGGDTVGQAVALEDWMKMLPPQSRPSKLLVLSDRHHFPRATWVAQLAVGGLGTRVKSSLADKEVPRRWIDPWSWQQIWPLQRDLLRMQFWRVSGSTGTDVNLLKSLLKRRGCWD